MMARIAETGAQPEVVGLSRCDGSLVTSGAWCAGSSFNTFTLSAEAYGYGLRVTAYGLL